MRFNVASSASASYVAQECAVPHNHVNKDAFSRTRAKPSISQAVMCSNVQLPAFMSPHSLRLVMRILHPITRPTLCYVCELERSSPHRNIHIYMYVQTTCVYICKHPTQPCMYADINTCVHRHSSKQNAHAFIHIKHSCMHTKSRSVFD